MAICKNNLAGIASDHFPIILSAQCDGTDPEKSKNPTTEWWEEETRDLLDMSPFALPAEDPERISLIDKYQQSLARGLAQPLRELHRLQQEWDQTQTVPALTAPQAPRLFPSRHLNQMWR